MQLNTLFGTVVLLENLYQIGYSFCYIKNYRYLFSIYYYSFSPCIDLTTRLRMRSIVQWLFGTSMSELCVLAIFKLYFYKKWSNKCLSFCYSENMKIRYCWLIFHCFQFCVLKMEALPKFQPLYYRICTEKPLCNYYYYLFQKSINQLLVSLHALTCFYGVQQFGYPYNCRLHWQGCKHQFNCLMLKNMNLKPDLFV